MTTLRLGSILLFGAYFFVGSCALRATENNQARRDKQAAKQDSSPVLPLAGEMLEAAISYHQASRERASRSISRGPDQFVAPAWQKALARLQAKLRESIQGLREEPPRQPLSFEGLTQRSSIDGTLRPLVRYDDALQRLRWKTAAEGGVDANLSCMKEALVPEESIRRLSYRNVLAHIPSTLSALDGCRFQDRAPHFVATFKERLLEAASFAPLVFLYPVDLLGHNLADHADAFFVRVRPLTIYPIELPTRWRVNAGTYQPPLKFADHDSEHAASQREVDRWWICQGSDQGGLLAHGIDGNDDAPGHGSRLRVPSHVVALHSLFPIDYDYRPGLCAPWLPPKDRSPASLSEFNEVNYLVSSDAYARILRQRFASFNAYLTSDEGKLQSTPQFAGEGVTSPLFSDLHETPVALVIPHAGETTHDKHTKQCPASTSPDPMRVEHRVAEWLRELSRDNQHLRKPSFGH